jgi:multicomponent Na+:H+ antiporter subunit A
MDTRIDHMPPVDDVGHSHVEARRPPSGGAGLALAALFAACFGWFLWTAVASAGAAPPAWRFDWVPSMGVSLAFRLDGLSLVFAMMITGVGALVMLYAHAYMAGAQMTGRFFATVVLFAIAMVGVVSSDDALAMFVFWEITSLTSFLLVGTDPAKGRKAAQQALLVTAMGGLALLGGLILLVQAADTTSLSGIVAALPAIADRGDVQAGLMLVVLGCATKSAQIPFHFWLPNAMAAPTPVSAYLHSATMVKAGVYLLARLDSGASLSVGWWDPLLSTLGLGTMVVGAYLALRMTDLKRLLAYSTVMALGTLVALLGVPGEKAAIAFSAFLIVHALYKAALFFVAGSVDHETGTRDTTLLGGLRAAMPVTAAAALVASLSMAGLPPMVGFLGKELVYEAKLNYSMLPAGTVVLAVLVNVVTVAVALMVAWHPFSGQLRPTPKTPHEAPWPMLVGPVLLSGLCLVFGLMPWLLEETVIGPAASAVYGGPVEPALKLWHGFNTVLWLSVATLAIGVLVFVRWQDVGAVAHALSAVDRIGPERGYQRILDGALETAARATDAIQGGRLRTYMQWLLVVTAATVAVPLVLGGGLAVGSPTMPGWVDVALAALAGGGAIATLTVKGMLPAALALGVLGLGMALLFLSLGAPDLAFTQFSVEVLFVVILVAIALNLKTSARDPRSRGQSWQDGTLAVVVGVVSAALLLAVTSGPFDPHLSRFFGQASVPQAFGHNVVNVIIVDFRALDTLGEIAVVVLAAAGVWMLARGSRQGGAGGQPGGMRIPSPIMETGLKLVVPLLVAMSVYILLRGHNAPGGGFIGGLIATSAVALIVLARGAKAAKRALRVHPLVIAGVGLVMATLSGLPALLDGARPFLTHLWFKQTVAGVELPLGTALVFDVGVFLVVVGGVSAMLIGLMGRSR